MNKVIFNSENDWSDKPSGDGLYKIKTNDDKIEIAVICGNIIKSIKNLSDSDPVHHPYYDDAKYLGPLNVLHYS